MTNMFDTTMYKFDNTEANYQNAFRLYKDFKSADTCKFCFLGMFEIIVRYSSTIFWTTIDLNILSLSMPILLSTVSYPFDSNSITL